MKQKIHIIAIAVFCTFASAIATTAMTAPAKPQTRVETDNISGAVLFIVNGQEQARIDQYGLHVRESVEYGGYLADIGPSNYEAIKAKNNAP